MPFTKFLGTVRRSTEISLPKSYYSPLLYKTDKFEKANTNCFRDTPLSTHQKLYIILQVSTHFASWFFGVKYFLPNSFVRQSWQNYTWCFFKIRYSNSGPLSGCRVVNYPPKNTVGLLLDNRGIIKLQFSWKKSCVYFFLETQRRLRFTPVFPWFSANFAKILCMLFPTCKYSANSIIRQHR